MAANPTRLFWDPYQTLTGGATPSSERSTHDNLQLTIQTPSMSFEPITPPQQIATYVLGDDEDFDPCASVKRLGPSPFPKDEIVRYDNSMKTMSHGPWVGPCDISFGANNTIETPSQESFIPYQCSNAMRYRNTSRAPLQVTSSAFDGLDFSVNNFTMANDQGSSKESASLCSLLAESLDNGESAEEPSAVSNDNYSNTGGDHNTSKVLLKGNNSAFDVINSSVVCMVEKNQERSEEPASSRSLSADSPDDGPSGEEPDATSDDNDGNAGEDPSTSSPLLQGENLAFSGIGPSVDACTGAIDLGRSKELVGSRSLSSKSSHGGTPEVEPAIVLDDDDSTSSRLDGQSIVTRSLEMATKVPIAPENRSPISDDCHIKNRKSAKRSRTAEIPAEVEKLPKRRHYDSSKNTILTKQDIHQTYRESKESHIALLMFVKDMFERKRLHEEEYEEYRRYIQAMEEATEVFERKFDLFEPDRPSRRRGRKGLKA